MSDQTTEAGAHREGLRALLDEYERRRRSAFQRAQALDSKALAELLPEHRGELEAAEACLARLPSTKEELEVAEGELDAYEKGIDLALSVITELSEKRAAGALPRLRRRRNVLVTAACLGIVVAGLVAWGRYTDQELVTAAPAPKAPPAAPTLHPAPTAAMTTVPKAPPAGPRLRPGPLATRMVAALWTHKGNGKKALDVTHFVDADGREVGERPGIHMIIGDKLYRWESRERTKASESCPPDQPSKFSGRILHDGALAPVDTGKRIPIGGYPPANEDNEEPAWNSYSPLAILGNVLFVRDDVQFGGCGANHPNEKVEAKVVEVHADGTTATIPMVDLRDGADALLDEAVKKLDDAVKVFDNERDVSRGEVTTTLGLPVFDATGAHWMLQYTIPTVSWSSDHVWSDDNTMSVRMELASLPERLTSQASFPAVVTTYAAAHRDEEVRGVSSGAFKPDDAGTKGPLDAGAGGSGMVGLADAGTQ